MKDLLVLVADLDTENVLNGIFPRLEKVCGIHSFTFDIRRHTNRDPGCANEGVDFLRPFTNNYRFAMIIFDREGSGQERKSRVEIEENLENLLALNGWNAAQIAVIVIDPEIENWIWIDSPNVSNAFNWNNSEKLYDWLSNNDWLEVGADKPERPKEALEKVLRISKKPRSASIYLEIAEKTSFAKCTDKAFVKMLNQLKLWFKPTPI
jgi:hypothetical protein